MAEKAASNAVDIPAPAPDHDCPATRFTLFPKLPVELRLKAWRYAFPPPRTLRIVQIKQKLEFPVTLWINSESRTETLKVYELVVHEYPRRLRRAMRVTCFAPGRDLVSFNVTELHSSRSNVFSPWSDLADQQIRGGLGVIQQLEVRGIARVIFGSRGDSADRSLKEVLLRFPGLENVKFVGTGCLLLHSQLEKQQVEDYKKQVLQYLAGNAGCFQQAGGPKVSFVDMETR
jgi:hypothetical protein